MSLYVNNLEITYKQLYETSLQIGQLIERGLYDDLLSYIEKKDRLLNESDSILKKIIAQGDNADKLQDLCQKIEEQEKSNIDALSLVQEGIKEEIKKTAKDKKIINAYTTKMSNEGSILDFRE